MQEITVIHCHICNLAKFNGAQAVFLMELTGHVNGHGTQRLFAGDRFLGISFCMNPSTPLHISIRTRHTDRERGCSGTEIIVEDTGPGFDLADESKLHTTLDNIRQRLEMMCGGSMTIKPREGGGTVVTITIPDSTTSSNAP